MSFANVLFYSAYIGFAVVVVGVLYHLRRLPLYEPRILFTLAASLWLFILHGYLIDFEGYLAAKPGFYQADIRLLSGVALWLMLVGLLAFLGGATLAQQLRLSPAPDYRDESLLVPVCLVLFGIGLLNFAVNVIVVSGGNLFTYLANFAVRSHELSNNIGFSAAGYLLAFVSVQVFAYLAGRDGASRGYLLLVLAAIGVVLIMRFSQGRIFQTLVLLGACYTAYSMGAAQHRGRSSAWLRQFPFLAAAGLAGLSIYFLRLASALNYLGIQVSLQTVERFGTNIVHFALERGNVPNFPVVFTILDKVPYEQSFLLGSSLFNWALFAVPKTILPGDYLISLWIKRIWYQDIEGGGLPPTAIGEWYANFGPMGVVAGMFVVGLIMGYLYRRAAKSRSPIASVLWANLAFGFIVIYPKTDLAQIPVFSLLILGSLWLLMLLLRSAARYSPR